MVDFQSRDTRRGPVADDDDDAEKAAESADEGVPSEEVGDEETTPEAAKPPGEGDTEQVAATSDDSERGRALASQSQPESESDPLAETEPAPATGDGMDPEQAVQADNQAAAQQSVEPVRTIDVAVVTVGDGNETAVVEGFESADHAIATRERLRGDYDGLQRSVDTLVGRDDVDVVVTTGGIGISPNAVTIEAVHPLLEKALPGFGEAFRTLLYDVIGTGIVAVRSAAGVADGTLVFCLPADAEAARLAVEEILVTEAPKLVAHLDESHPDE